MNKIKYFCCFLNRASQNIVYDVSQVKIITDINRTSNLPQNMTRDNSVDFRVYNKDDSNRNSVDNNINSKRKKYIIPRSRSHSISPMDTPVSSFRAFSNSFVRTNSQCDLCRETSALTHSKIYCSHEPNINLCSGAPLQGNQDRDMPHSGLEPRIEVKNDDNIIYF